MHTNQGGAPGPFFSPLFAHHLRSAFPTLHSSFFILYRLLFSPSSHSSFSILHSQFFIHLSPALAEQRGEAESREAR
jgi:hypothetical protein